MAILVTGGAGYIGSHMVWDLLDAGEEVVVLDRLSTGHAWAVAPGARLVVGDIGDTRLVGRLIRDAGIESIFHFAGSVVVPDSIADPLGYYLNNTSNTRTLVEEAVAGGVRRFIFSSTAAVYGAPPAEAPVSEAVVPAPVTPYGKSKLMSEWMLADTAAAHDLSYAILRYFNVAGCDPQGRTGQSTPGATHLLKVACEAAIGKRPYVQVFGTDYATPDGSGIRDFIHVSDLVAAHRLALMALREQGGGMTINCGYGHGYSVLEVLDSVQRVSGRKLDIRMAPRRDGDLASVIADTSLIRRKLAFSPSLDDLDTIVATSLEWEAHLKRMDNAAPEPLRAIA
ncbi:UDP-glucose 4-epimerase GalE [Chelativorans sp. ZYF759]|uniref:UDP-glucose 4-epimerase GalE n=1 Tax=Chelativorans sp. ZYF759 TaxID=2692213 RepID=UPI00145F1079|nr:UDP-glucose 4-epimerase GalE [Chelativorans sp. ZYF759]NMG40896.1 UDP-glucose 4-epimerase GalE [Chelativorans sp. ZYF759]